MTSRNDTPGGLFDASGYGCRHEKATYGRSINSDGSSRVWQRCDACGDNVGGPGAWIPHQELGQPLQSLPVFDDAYRQARPPCVRCGRFGTQLHHWFPRHTAADNGLADTEPDLWPTAWLCVDCHAQWHRMVDGT